MKLAVLISGRGSNLKALIDATSQPDFPAEICLVVSNREGADGLQLAYSAGIATVIIKAEDFNTREDFDATLDARIKGSGAELICLAGFLWHLGEAFVRNWWDRVLNIHPSILPAFKGLRAQAQAIDMGVRFSGCTVHFVRPDLDDGPIIAQAVVPVLPVDDVDALSARILKEEHRIYPLAVRWVAEGRVSILGKHVFIDVD